MRSADCRRKILPERSRVKARGIGATVAAKIESDDAHARVYERLCVGKLGAEVRVAFVSQDHDGLALAGFDGVEPKMVGSVKPDRMRRYGIGKADRLQRRRHGSCCGRDACGREQ